MPGLLDKRLVLVTGKGGVGKTTVAAALGLKAARQGRRTIVCEGAEQERLAGLFGASLSDYRAPGLTELVTIGKVWELAQLQRKTPKAAPYDLVIVDPPATGHGLAMLRAPRTFSEVARVGPIHRQAGIIHRFLIDPSATGVLTVALPEEIPVSETVDLGTRLREEMGMGIDRIVVNQVLPE